jgi:hypothetical protein
MQLFSAWDRPPEAAAAASDFAFQVRLAHAVRPDELTSLCNRPMAYRPGTAWPPAAPLCRRCVGAATLLAEAAETAVNDGATRRRPTSTSKTPGKRLKFPRL